MKINVLIVFLSFVLFVQTVEGQLSDTYFLPNGNIAKQEICDNGEILDVIRFEKQCNLDTIYPFDSLDVKPNNEPTIESFNNFLTRRFADYIMYPSEALEQEIMGNVYISFVITEDGNIDCVEDLRFVPILSDYCENLVRTMPPIIPGIKDGKPVNAKYIYKFTFRFD